MNWVWANKEWVFSGAGVALLGLLYKLLLKSRPADNSGHVSTGRNSPMFGSPVASGSNISQIINITTEPPSSQSPPTKVHPEKPRPDEIHAHLESLPVFQRKAAKESYVGLKVRWPVSLVDLQELPQVLRSRPEHSHTLVTRSTKGQEIDADIDIENFPRLKISHCGAPLRVSGTIKHTGITGMTYRLENVEIEFEE